MPLSVFCYIAGATFVWDNIMYSESGLTRLIINERIELQHWEWLKNQYPNSNYYQSRYDKKRKAINYLYNQYETIK